MTKKSFAIIPASVILLAACAESMTQENKLSEGAENRAAQQEKSQRYATVTEEAYQTFKVIQKIRDLAAQTVNDLMASDQQIYVEDGRRRHPNPNPYGGETDQGILLQTDALFTPWGWVQLFGKGSNDTVQTAFVEKLKVGLSTASNGQEKATYQVNQVDTNTLPEPSEKTSPTSYIPHEIALKVWRELDTRYKKEFEGISPIYIKGQEPNQPWYNWVNKQMGITTVSVGVIITSHSLAMVLQDCTECSSTCRSKSSSPKPTRSRRPKKT